MSAGFHFGMKLAVVCSVCEHVKFGNIIKSLVLLSHSSRLHSSSLLGFA